LDTLIVVAVTLVITAEPLLPVESKPVTLIRIPFVIPSEMKDPVERVKLDAAESAERLIGPVVGPIVSVVAVTARILERVLLSAEVNRLAFICMPTWNPSVRNDPVVRVNPVAVAAIFARPVVGPVAITA
jgi:hypothetical protein